MGKITLKNEREVALLEKGGKILATTLKAVKKMAEKGVTEKITAKQLDELAEGMIRQAGGEPAFLGYDGFPGSLCVSINNEIVHGFPTEDKIIQKGDLVKLDLGVKYQNLYTDAAITVPVGEISETAQKLMEATRNSLKKGLAKIRPGARLGDYGSTVDQYAKSQGFTTVKNLVGHGVGHAVHEAPQIPNYGKSGEGLEFKEGMVLALEPMLNEGNDEIKLAKNGFVFKTKDNKLSAHFEHTIVVTEGGNRILTELKEENEQEEKYILGIDWGKKKIGLAIADNETKIATGLKEINDKNRLSEINILKNKFNIKDIVLGVSRQKIFKSNQKDILKFKQVLEEKGFNVFGEEEAFSTKLAQGNLIQKIVKNISKQDNVESARIILQAWLDKEK